MSGQARTRVGVIGAGNIATIAQLPTLVKRDDVELAALVSRRQDPGPLMRRWGFGAAYATVEDMLDGRGPGRGLRADPPVGACPRRRRLPAGATSTSSARSRSRRPSTRRERLADLADQRGRILMVDFNRRYAPVYVAGREAFGASRRDLLRRPEEPARARNTARPSRTPSTWSTCCAGTAAASPSRSPRTPRVRTRGRRTGPQRIIRFDSGNTGVLMAARTAGAWNEKLDAYGAGRSAEVQAPESVSITVDGVTTTREISAPRPSAGRPRRETLGFAAAVHHFLDRMRRPPAALDLRARRRRHPDGCSTASSQAAGLPTHEQEGRQWASHATNAVPQRA